ncbi:MAG: hypothetical protein WCY78_05055 [Sphaerochaetaceae bacterium]
MRKKILMVLALVILVSSISLVAATPSVFDIGLVNAYSIGSLMGQDFAAYTPGIRLSGYLCKWFGLSLDVAVEAPFADLEADEFGLEVVADAVFRYPFGLVEPYLAVGPAYRMAVGATEFVVAEEVLLSARAGLDFNILPMLGVGIEARHFMDLPLLVADTEAYAEGALDNTKVAITIKAKF